MYILILFEDNPPNYEQIKKKIIEFGIELISLLNFLVIWSHLLEIIHAFLKHNDNTLCNKFTNTDSMYILILFEDNPHNYEQIKKKS